VRIAPPHRRMAHARRLRMRPRQGWHGKMKPNIDQVVKEKINA